MCAQNTRTRHSLISSSGLSERPQTSHVRGAWSRCRSLSGSEPVSRQQSPHSRQWQRVALLPRPIHPLSELLRTPRRAKTMRAPACHRKPAAIIAQILRRSLRHQLRQPQRRETHPDHLRRQSRPSQPDQPLHQRLKPAQPLLHSPAPGVVVGCRVTVAGGLLCGLLASFSSGQGLLQAGLARAGAHVSLTPSSVPTSSRAAAMPSAASPDRAQQAAESARSLGVDAEHGDEVIGVLEARE